MIYLVDKDLFIIDTAVPCTDIKTASIFSYNKLHLFLRDEWLGTQGSIHQWHCSSMHKNLA